jgi:hypothetical protein
MAKRSDALLETYRKKRDFSRTPEPDGSKAANRKGQKLSFVIQKHEATRLHYDFRLELDGVLKSWAVTKGRTTGPTHFAAYSLLNTFQDKPRWVPVTPKGVHNVLLRDTSGMTRIRRFVACQALVDE